jgi:hypothetical protein
MKNLQFFILIFSYLAFHPCAAAKNFMIFSVAQDVPMGDGTPVHKNYYINMGSAQGLTEGTELSVYRTVARVNPYAVDKNVSYKVKVGELKVIHTEEENAIAILQKLKAKEGLYLEIPSLNIGDLVSVKIED